MSIRNVGSEGNSWYSILTTDEQLSTVELNKLSVSLYPNPVSQDFINIKSQSVGEKIIQLYDLNGRKLIDTILYTDNLYIGNLSNGVYMMKITINGRIKIIKLIVNN